MKNKKKMEIRKIVTYLYFAWLKDYNIKFNNDKNEWHIIELDDNGVFITCNENFSYMDINENIHNETCKRTIFKFFNEFENVRVQWPKEVFLKKKKRIQL